MSDTLRAFIAVELGDEAASVVRALQRQMADAVPRGAVRWAKPDQLHLTLQFLGNVAADRVEALKGSLAAALAGTPAFTLRLDRVGAFPSLRAPRVIWVGLTGDVPALAALQSRVADASRDVGDHTETRDFHPHLTLGRVNRRDPWEARVLETVIASQPPPPPAAWRVDEVRLFRSALQPSGAVYSVLGRFALA